ncbi:hypothetical protein [Nocardia sp. BMG111209]|uniref:hypothetical protein n=1 Tax=Nocardia sp. BMG111209 TaxID=1160137 RepID=UPI00037CE1D7|nr:hypothetical protein [Nocardia sp. BMG111209]
MSGDDDNQPAARGEDPSTPDGTGIPTPPTTSGPLAGDPALAGLNIRPGQRIRVLATWLWWRLDDRQRHGLGHADLVRTLRLGLSAETLARATLPGRPLSGDRPGRVTLPRAGFPSDRATPPDPAMSADTVPSAHHDDPGDPVRADRHSPASRNGNGRPAGHTGIGDSAGPENLLAELLAATGVDAIPTPLRSAVALAARLPAAAVDRRLCHLVADLLGESPTRATGSGLRLRAALRHLDRTRTQLVARTVTGDPIADALHGWMLAALTAAACAVAADPERHRSTGLVPPGPVIHDHRSAPLPALASTPATR